MTEIETEQVQPGAEPGDELDTGDGELDGGDEVAPGDDELVPGDNELEEPELHREGRCEAETTVGGSLYRCSLESDHDGEHAFQPVEADDADRNDRDAAERLVAEQAKKLDRATKAYSGKVVEALGADLGGFLSCELCEPFYPGLRLPVPLTAEQIATLRNVIGLPSLETMVQDKFSRQCPDCEGKGKVLTGSAIAKYASITCLSCKGKGWVPIGDERRLDHHRTDEGPPAPGDEHGELDADAPPDADPWGRPKGDPDYGRLPQYVA